MKEIVFEYGEGTITAQLPEQTDIFIPGVTVKDPQHIKEEDIYEATLNSLRNPIGMKPIDQLVEKGSKVTIVFPDRVKGGEHPTAHRRVSIKLVLKELYSVGVEKEDILLICSNGLHRKNTVKEIMSILGDELFYEFDSNNQIINHDSEDYENLVDLGVTEYGDPVIVNKFVFDSDLCIMIGHAQGNPYGGYSGGYKHAATGITHWKSIASHHVPKVMHRPDFVPVNKKSLMRQKFDQIGQHIEKCMGRKFFMCDAVLDSKSRQIEIKSGYAGLMQGESWEVADKRTFIPFATKKYDVLIFGAPQFFHYGDGMGTNPIMLMQSISAQVTRLKRVLSDRCVIICAANINGFWNEDLWPYLPEMYDLFQKNRMNTLPDLNRYGQYFATNEDYIRKYRFANAYHPFHGFSMISSAHIAEKHTAAIYICGSLEPGLARGMGMKTRETIEEALEDAKLKYVGSEPNILALPQTFKLASVHLTMKE